MKWAIFLPHLTMYHTTVTSVLHYQLTILHVDKE